MISVAMIFLGTVSLLAALAAWAAEEGVRRLGMPTRWIWLGAMAASPMLLIGPVLVPGGAPHALKRAIGIGQVFELSPIVLAPDPTGMGLRGPDVALAVVWGLFSIALLGLLVRTHRGLRRERSGWEVSDVLGRDVYLSSDRGPAVAGVLRPWIVLPRWALTLTDSQLSLVVLHEEEHVRGGDAFFLAAALSLVVVTPWNPIAWWQLRRLRMAMEVDCDRRVLSREPDRERYGNSLLAVAARASGASLGLAAFTERSFSLKRRILAMTARHSRWTPLRAGLFLLLALLIGVQACGVETPVAPYAPVQDVQDVGLPDPPRATPPADIRAEPTFTPFTAAPSITNRQEVVEALRAEYPPLLRDAGVGGSVRVYFLINEYGRVEDVRIDQSSGHRALDDAAVRVADVYRFQPALYDEIPVPVWVSFPITFQVK